MRVLHDAARRYRQEGDPPIEETALYALRLIDKTEALERVRLLLSSQGTWSFDVPEQEAVRRLERSLQDDLHELETQRREARQRSLPPADTGQADEKAGGDQASSAAAARASVQGRKRRQ